MAASALSAMLSGQGAPLAAPAAAPAAPPAPAPTMTPTPSNNALAQMGVDPSLVAMLDERRAAHRQLSETSMEDLEDIQTQRQAIVNRPLTRPEVPDLPEVPEPPPTTMPSSGRRVFGQFLPVLAMLGGALVRRDATAALRTGAAAMRAARANDQQNLELQQQHWNNQVQQIVTDRESMLAQYRSALEDADLDMNQRLALLGALSAQENNIELRTRVSMGDLEGIANNINTQMRAVEALRTQLRQDAEAASRIEARARGGARGGGGTLAGAEQRGRIVMALPNVVAGLATMERIENATIPQGSETGSNPLSEEYWANFLGDIPFIGGDIERSMTQGNTDYQEYANAVATLEQSFIPMFAGAATTESEARRYVRANAPVRGDSWQIVRNKRLNLQRLANQGALIAGLPIPYEGVGYLDPRDPNAAAMLRAIEEANAPASSSGGGDRLNPEDVQQGDVVDGYMYTGPNDGDRSDPNNWERQ